MKSFDKKDLLLKKRGAADAKGPTAGFDPVVKPRKRYIYQRGLRKNWKKKDG